MDKHCPSQILFEKPLELKQLKCFNLFNLIVVILKMLKKIEFYGVQTFYLVAFSLCL